AFLLGAFPWMSQLKKLDIHFEPPQVKLKPIANLFASIFSMGFFLFIRGTLPKTLLSSFFGWGVFLFTAFVLVLVYIYIYIHFREQVKLGKVKWPIITTFLLYVLIWVSFTGAFGVLTTYAQNYVLNGKIVEKGNTKGIYGAKLSILNQQQNVIASDNSDEEGDFQIVVNRDEIEQCKYITVHSDEYRSIQFTIEDPYNLEEEIELLKTAKKL
ncbi:MAG: hypothetical protein ACPGQR_06020, partial [Marinirhabdus sp.]